VAVAGYIFRGGGGLTLYIQIFQGANMSLFRYSFAFLCWVKWFNTGQG